jgi:hypothetical protein
MGKKQIQFLFPKNKKEIINILLKSSNYNYYLLKNVVNEIFIEKEKNVFILKVEDIIQLVHRLLVLRLLPKGFINKVLEEELNTKLEFKIADQVLRSAIEILLNGEDFEIYVIFGQEERSLEEFKLNPLYWEKETFDFSLNSSHK